MSQKIPHIELRAQLSNKLRRYAPVPECPRCYIAALAALARQRSERTIAGAIARRSILERWSSQLGRSKQGYHEWRRARTYTATEDAQVHGLPSFGKCHRRFQLRLCGVVLSSRSITGTASCRIGAGRLGRTGSRSSTSTPC